MNKLITIIYLLLGALSFLQRADAALRSAAEPAGYVARLLINEVPFPGEHGYVSEADTKMAMCALIHVLDSRINKVPSGYHRSEVASVDSDNVLDIITAGGVRGQMDGFYYNNGRPAMVSRITARINNLVRISKQGAPGRFARLISYAQKISSDYVDRGVVPRPDLFEGIRFIAPHKVTGCAYSWMTDKGYYHPGGTFVKIPDRKQGRLGGNRFYTLVQKSSTQKPKRKSLVSASK